MITECAVRGCRATRFAELGIRFEIDAATVETLVAVCEQHYGYAIVGTLGAVSIDKPIDQHPPSVEHLTRFGIQHPTDFGVDQARRAADLAEQARRCQRMQRANVRRTQCVLIEGHSQFHEWRRGPGDVVRWAP